MRNFFLKVLLLICITDVWATSFSDGERLFRQNKPMEAIPVLLQASLTPGVNPAVFNYLGLCYMQIYKYQEALDAFLRGTSVSGSNKKILYLNAGNAAFALENYGKAEELYSFSIAADPSYAPVVLNRANSRISLQKLSEAAADYMLYLELEPNAPQRAVIESVVVLIDEELAAETMEKERIAQEDIRIAAEKERLIAQKALEAQETTRLQAELRKQEEERIAKVQEEERIIEEKAALEAQAAAVRRQKLLEEIASSVQNAEEATSISAGTEGVLKYEYESELE